jgi:hexosaminidase
MKNCTILAVVCLFFVSIFPPLFAQSSPLSIVPIPAQMSVGTGNFIISPRTQIVVPNADPAFRRVAQLFADRLRIDGTKVAVIDLNNSKSITNTIVFIKTDTEGLGTEGYRLNVSPTQIIISTATPNGAFYAVQTLFQLLPSDVYNLKPIKSMGGWKIPCVNIEDEPRFEYRGLMLDVSRHFFPTWFIKEYIDVLAMHKMNRFHWHLTDDQGWRIEIKKYPKLTEIGAYRSETLIGHYRNNPKKYDGTRYGGFYTQAEIRDVVKYATDRFVTIIPEIEMPGHSVAVLAAYPELSCDTSKTYEVARYWGVHKDVLCPSEKTFSFLEDVLTEVFELFPSKTIHIGGDECPKDAWKKSDFCQNLMKKEGLKDEDELQSYFIKRMEKFINSKGRRIIGWDEILEGGLAPNAAVMSWRGVKGGIEAAKEKHEVVMSPTTYCYLDYYQANPDTEPLAIGGLLTLEKVYSYDPIPTELSADEAKYIRGVQGNVWTEYIASPSYAEYMSFPRGLAIAEIGWSPKSRRDYTDFTKRLTTHFKRLDKINVNYAQKLFSVKMALNAEKTPPSVILTTATDNVEMRYTTDGSEPRANSNLYTKPVIIGQTSTVRAAVFQNGVRKSDVSEERFFVHPTLGKKYTFKSPPTKTYESGNMGLTNGQIGNLKDDNQWVGFESKDAEVIFDLGTPTPLSKIRLNFLNKPNSWVFLPDFVTVAVSEDGEEWRDIDRVDYEISRDFQKAFIREARLNVSEYTKPKRYVKILAKNIGVCPKGHAGEGKPAWVFLDEIMIE